MGLALENAGLSRQRLRISVEGQIADWYVTH